VLVSRERINDSAGAMTAATTETKGAGGPLRGAGTGTGAHAGRPWTAGEGRKFGLMVGTAFLVLAAVLWWRDREMLRNITASLGGLLVLAGLILPAQLGPVYRAWMKLALAISKVTTPIFMGIIFFLVITPAALLARLFGHRPLRHPGSSNFIVRTEAKGKRSNLERQF
jgi:hypothetical protein